MKKYILFLVILAFPVSLFAYYGGRSDYCKYDQKTGNFYCNKSIASRYGGNRIDYSDKVRPQSTYDYLKARQVCPLNSHYERYPTEGCVCNNGYITAQGRSFCEKEKEQISTEAFAVLWKAVNGHRLTQREKARKGEIIRWINDAFE